MNPFPEFRTFSLPSSGSDDTFDVTPRDRRHNGGFQQPMAATWGDATNATSLRHVIHNTGLNTYDNSWQWRWRDLKEAEDEEVEFSSPPTDIPQGFGKQETIRESSKLEPAEMLLKRRRENIKKSREECGMTFPRYVSTIPFNHPDRVEKTESTSSENVIANDERLRVSPCTSQPYRWLCSLVMTTQNGTRYIGSGSFTTMLGKRLPGLILTCAHNLYMHDERGYIDSVKVYPARDSNTAPLGSFVVHRENFRVPEEWIRSEDGDANYDYGVIFLPQGEENTPSAEYGFGYQILRDLDLQNRVVTVGGYPSDKPNGTLWIGGGKIRRVEQNMIHYDADTKGGQSGSPVWTWNRYNWMVIGIHGYGGQLDNTARRITPEMVRNVLKWSRELQTNKPTRNDNVFVNP